MTTEQLATMNATFKRYANIHAIHKLEVEQIRSEWWALAKTCDHKYPDGKDAHEGDMFCVVCKICGANDM